MSEKKKCFVVMGFGKKTDYATGRVLDLDKSYRTIIRPAAIAAGLECVRADEIMHSGTIDVPMYQQLLKADVVVADLSTSNTNAFYELGVRHALRPFTTITIAEDKLVNPFDVNHIVIRRYHHMGEGIDYEEVERMRADLQKAMEVIAAKEVNDSPVYEFLKNLKPPSLVEEAVAFAMPMMAGDAPVANPTVSVLLGQVDEAFKRSDFLTAKSLLSVVRTIVPSDTGVVQKLALATYKSNLPTPMKALEEAQQILSALDLDVSTDTETLGLLGAIQKRMWDQTLDRKYLDRAIFGYEKGFYLKNDYYNGINLAFLLNVRASIQLAPEEAIADFVLARRTRERVMEIAEARLAKAQPDEKYWILATIAEAAFGIGGKAKAQPFIDQAANLNPPPAQWMKDSTQQQLDRLEKLMAASPLDRIK